MSHYNPYPTYKDSGVEWLGAVPSDWQPTSLAYLGSYLNGYPFAPEQWSAEGLPIIRIAQLTGKPFDNFYDGIAPAHLRVEDGDLLFSWSATIDCFIWDRGPAWLNQHIFRVLPSIEADKRFLYHLLRHVAPKLAEFDAHGSTMRHIKKESLKERVYVPDLSVQRAIAAHLDRETARIDSLVEKKTRFIELLREKRQALIAHAVTKGLDRYAKIVDSGVEWLGELPEHWRVAPLKYSAKFLSGGTPSKDNQEFWNGHIPWASAKDLKQDKLDDTQDHITANALEENAASLVPTGSILVVVRGMILARIFPVSQTLVPMAINQDLKAVIPEKGMTPGYLAYLLKGLSAVTRSRLEEAGHGTKALRMENWVSMKLPIPPEEEQRQIFEFLDRETSRLDLLIAKTERSIDLLKERRSALITAAVTGQIDLREPA